MEPEPDTPEPEKKFDLEQLKFYKSVKYKMLTSFVIGILSGFLAGIVVVILVFTYVSEVPIPSTVVSWLIVFSVVSIALFLWGLVRSLKASP